VTFPATVTNIGDDAFHVCSHLSRAYFMGNAPTYGASSFLSAPSTIYYRPNTTGWGPFFAGRPTCLWNPTVSRASLDAGVLTLSIACDTNTPIAVEATTNLYAGPWLRLQVTNLSSGTLVLRDTASTNYPARFYRIIGP
jgi:hypothetical protein